MPSPKLFHEEIGTINITSERTFRAAKIFWDAIEAQYIPKKEPVIIPQANPEPVELKTDKPVQVKPAGIKATTKKKSHGNQSGSSWLPEETAVIKGCKEVSEAWAAYKTAFPLGQRNRNAIDQKLRKLRRKVEGPRSRKHGNLQIPFSTKTHKKEYQAAWSLCRSYGFVSYPEALKLKEARKTKKGDKPKVEKKGPISALQQPETDTKGEPDPDIKIEGGETLIDKMPEIRPPTREAHKRVHEAAAAAAIRHPIPDEFKVGAHVKQVKPYHDRKVSGIGIITARVHGLVEVNFNGSQYYKIAPDCLEVI